MRPVPLRKPAQLAAENVVHQMLPRRYWVTNAPMQKWLGRCHFAGTVKQTLWSKCFWTCDHQQISKKYVFAVRIHYTDVANQMLLATGFLSVLPTDVAWHQFQSTDVCRQILLGQHFSPKCAHHMLFMNYCLQDIAWKMLSTKCCPEDIG